MRSFIGFTAVSRCGIGKDLQLSPQTVSRALRQHAADRREGRLSADSPVPPESAAEASWTLTTQVSGILLERYPKITAKRIMEEIQADGYAGGYSILSECIARLRPRDGKPFTERFETGPGVQAQMDYALYTLDFTSERRRRVTCFSLYSGLLTAAVPAVCGEPGSGDDAAGTRAGV